MSKTRILKLCLYFTLFGSVVKGEAHSDNQQAIGKTNIRNNFPKIFRPIKRVVKRFLGIKENIYLCGYREEFINVVLSSTEITSNCASGSVCQSNSQLIDVATSTNDIGVSASTYIYSISGGKIVGEGANVVWDLSGVKQGEYAITITAGNEIGRIGSPISRTVKVVQCIACK